MVMVATHLASASDNDIISAYESAVGKCKRIASTVNNTLLGYNAGARFHALCSCSC